MKLCLEEMALDLLGGVVRAQEEVRVEVWVKVAGVVVEWGVTVLGLALVAPVSALVVVPGCPIK